VVCARMLGVCGRRSGMWARRRSVRCARGGVRRRARQGFVLVAERPAVRRVARVAVGRVAVGARLRGAMTASRRAGPPRGMGTRPGLQPCSPPVRPRRAVGIRRRLQACALAEASAVTARAW